MWVSYITHEVSIIYIMHEACYFKLLCNIHVGLYTDLQPTHSTMLSMCLTVVLATRYVAIPHQPAVEVRNEVTTIILFNLLYYSGTPR